MKIVLKVAITCKKCKTCVLGISSKIKGIKSLAYDEEKSTLTVVGEVDVVEIVAALRKAKHPAEVVSVTDEKKEAEEKKKKEEEEKKKKEEEEKKKKECEAKKKCCCPMPCPTCPKPCGPPPCLPLCPPACPPPCPPPFMKQCQPCYIPIEDEYPGPCTISRPVGPGPSKVQTHFTLCLSLTVTALFNRDHRNGAPCGDAAAAAELTSFCIRDGAGLPPLPGRGGGGGGGNATERYEEGDKSKNARKEKSGSQRIAGWGLREYSKIVSKKVETKGRTTYNEVADEICGELKLKLNGQEFDEKNIRRRVYDAFNVLIALRVIAKDKKEIKWMGLSNFRYEKIKKLEEAHKELMSRIKNKKNLLQEIEKQFDDLQNIKFRNQLLQRPAESVNGICLPFLLVKASRKARVEIEISEDSKFAGFDFNCTPFTLHDDVSILDGIRRNSIRRAG